jgi:hypothetical protein
VQRAVCALLHILVLKGFVLKLQPLVGRNPAKTNPKIQGFTPTDKWPAVRLVSTRVENTRPSDDFMNSITAAARIATLLAIGLMLATPLATQGTNYEGPVGVTGIFNGNVTIGGRDIDTLLIATRHKDDSLFFKTRKGQVGSNRNM